MRSKRTVTKLSFIPYSFAISAMELAYQYRRTKTFCALSGKDLTNLFKTSFSATEEQMKAAINADAQKARQILGLATSDDPITELPPDRF